MAKTMRGVSDQHLAISSKLNTALSLPHLTRPRVQRYYLTIGHVGFGLIYNVRLAFGLCDAYMR